MSRIEENKIARDTVTSFLRSADDRGLTESETALGILSMVAIDISKSLAVIADALSKEVEK